MLIPMRFDRTKTNLGVFSYQGVARLKPGITLKQADADLARMLPLVRGAFPRLPVIPSECSRMHASLQISDR